MPGVSISNAPPGSATSRRAVVVWRPLPLSSLTAATRATSPPISRLTSVDFPTPDDPTSATVLGRLQIRRERVEPTIVQTR